MGNKESVKAYFREPSETSLVVILLETPGLEERVAEYAFCAGVIGDGASQEFNLSLAPLI